MNVNGRKHANVMTNHNFECVRDSADWTVNFVIDSIILCICVCVNWYWMHSIRYLLAYVPCTGLDRSLRCVIHRRIYGENNTKHDYALFMMGSHKFFMNVIYISIAFDCHRSADEREKKKKKHVPLYTHYANKRSSRYLFLNDLPIVRKSARVG